MRDCGRSRVLRSTKSITSINSVQFAAITTGTTAVNQSNSLASMRSNSILTERNTRKLAETANYRLPIRRLVKDAGGVSQTHRMPNESSLRKSMSSQTKVRQSKMSF